MKKYHLWTASVPIIAASLLLTSCATTQSTTQTSSYQAYQTQKSYNPEEYASRLPQKVSYGKERVVLVDPKVYAWGAYDSNGDLIRAGVATAGADICEDDDRSCRTHAGTYRITSMGDEDCYSHKYPKPNGGGLMPYCMFFNNGESLHGSPDNIVTDANLSHGCVRMRIPDAEWMRYDFAKVGTKVVILPYN